MNNEAPDRLSELPESLILHILSFVGMRDVVRTTLLSKSWKYLWTTLPCLNFNENSCSVTTRRFVTRALMHWKGIKIRKLEIEFAGGFYSDSFDDMNSWLRFAKERNVEELSICLPLNHEYWLPQSLYECSSLTKLTLFRCNLRIPGNVQWHQVKSLTMSGFNLTEDVINQVVSGSPRLECFVLFFRGGFRSLSIQSTSVRELYLYSYDHDPSDYTVLTLRTPNLRGFCIDGAPFSKCLLTDVSSLTVAKLDFRDKGAQDGESLAQILPAIQHVETLELSACCFKVLGVMKLKYSFSNVKLLRIRDRPIEPNKIVGLFKNFPRLKTLVFLNT